MIKLRMFKRLRSTFNNMKQRCYNPNSISYDYYGGRGIKVCDEWLDPKFGFESFVLRMGKCPDGYVIDRIDPDGHYEPSNCRWADLSVSNKNRRPFNEARKQKKAKK